MTANSDKEKFFTERHGSFRDSDCAYESRHEQIDRDDEAQFELSEDGAAAGINESGIFRQRVTVTIRQLEGEVKELRQKNMEKNMMNQSLQEEMASAIDQIRRLEQLNKEQAEVIQSLETENMDIKKENDQYKLAYVKMASENEKLKDKIQAQEDDKDQASLDERNDDLKGQEVRDEDEQAKETTVTDQQLQLAFFQDISQKLDDLSSKTERKGSDASPLPSSKEYRRIKEQMKTLKQFNDRMNDAYELQKQNLQRAYQDKDLAQKETQKYKDQIGDLESNLSQKQK